MEIFKSELFWNAVITLLIGGAGVGGLLPIIEGWTRRGKVQQALEAEKQRQSELETGRQIRDELRADLEDREGQIRAKDTFIESWRIHAYDLRELIIGGKQGVIAILRRLEDLIEKGDHETARAAARKYREETEQFTLPPIPKQDAPPRSSPPKP